MDNEYFDFKLEVVEFEKWSLRFYFLYLWSFVCEIEYFIFLLRVVNDNVMDLVIYIIRLLSLVLVKRFLCNVSKMVYFMRNWMVCDGYFGCLDDYIILDKGNGEIFFDFFLCM